MKPNRHAERFLQQRAWWQSRDGSLLELDRAELVYGADVVHYVLAPLLREGLAVLDASATWLVITPAGFAYAYPGGIDHG